MSMLMDVIRNRRSIRRYRSDAVPDESIAQILEAARWAQSWANTQCWEVVVVRDQSVKDRLRQAIPEGNPAARCIQAAPVVLALCGRRNVSGFYQGVAVTRFGDWMLFDLGVAAQNIALAAHDLGLGTVVLGLFDHDAARLTLNVPEGIDVVALMPLGYPAADVAPPPRRACDEFTHYERF